MQRGLENINISEKLTEKRNKTQWEFDPSNRKFMLCLKEKYHILFNPDGISQTTNTENLKGDYFI